MAGTEGKAAGLLAQQHGGQITVANPDLPERLRHGYPFAPHDPATLFGGGEKGLIDYPTYQAAPQPHTA